MNTPHRLSDFLDQPGRSGPFGGILDEYARAAHELCDLVEGIDEATFAAARSSPDPDTTSLRQICRHCVNAAFGYSNYIRQARGEEVDRSQVLGEDHPLLPAELRIRLGQALRHTEATVQPIWDADGAAIIGLTFKSRWGQTYDPDSILEHGIVHLLRHRRQIERWLAGIA